VRSEFIIMLGSALTGVVLSVPCDFCLCVLLICLLQIHVPLFVVLSCVAVVVKCEM